jgi:hypothetical protein
VCLCVQAYGYELPADIERLYTTVRKTHNSGVFDAYTEEMRRARHSHILTGKYASTYLRFLAGSKLLSLQRTVPDLFGTEDTPVRSVQACYDYW